ncbi:hypothetical protein ACSQ67_017299 [Phaseolus vulgaris]
MKSLGLSHLLQILTCILLLTSSFSKDDRKTYIIYMGEYPKGMEITESFHTSMVQSVLDSKFASDTLLHRYKSFNGFVARLTKEESERMKGMDGVVSVIPDRVHNVETSRSWNFLNFPENVPRTNEESNIIVGVIDTGIWISNANSFTGGGFGPPPQKWKGTCYNFTCNNKVIGAKHFRIGVTKDFSQHIQGISVNTFSPPQNGYPIVYGGDVPAPGFNSSTSRLCTNNSLNGALVRGKIVLCDGYASSVRVGFASGAAGVIFSSTLPLVVAGVFAFPAVHISSSDGQSVYNYLKSTSNPTAIISKSYEGIDSAAPYIAPFSSRGPNTITPNILKVNFMHAKLILCPFLISQFKNPSCIYIFTTKFVGLSFTATPLNPALNPDAEFAYGAGQINPLKAVNPGLVYDAGPNDYVNFLCGQGYNTSTLQTITGDNNTCTSANRGYVFNLNLPSFALSTALSKKNNVTFGRTVTNVGSARSTYRATVSGNPSSLSIQAVPNVLTFTSVGQRLSFTLRIQGTINANLVSFPLTWDDGTHQVRSPIVVYVP